MTYPEWNPHEDPRYDALLGPASADALNEVMNGGAAAAEAFLRDTREMHGRLYAPFAPKAHPEYAGTYRGTTGTSLETRVAGANMVTEEKIYYFIEPARVQHFLDVPYKNAVDQLISAPETATPDQLFQHAARVFYIFGMIHPYLDGNGHIQRLIFAAAVAQHKALNLAPTWYIHPRPYDIEMAAAFEQRSGALAAVTALLSMHVTR